MQHGCTFFAVLLKPVLLIVGILLLSQGSIPTVASSYGVLKKLVWLLHRKYEKE